ncbi:MAG: hypothetical protein J6A73_04745 [Lachnospiraceae bacterium]|nr:hypothetical protein [Lachnospiraceae bacterium]
MKKYLIVFLVLILCFSFSFSVSAESENDDSSSDYLTGVFKIGDEVYYTCEIMYTYRGTEYHWSMDMRTTITETNKMMCLYYDDYSLSSVGYHLNEMGVPGGTENLYQDLKSDGTEYTNQACTNVQPTLYIDTSVYDSCFDVYFLTNLPIFESYEAAIAYRSGELGIEKAVNYKKVFENGNWVSPFEDIEINDSNIPTPELSNVSHNGFTVTNAPDERYMVDVYMESGIQNPLPYEKNMTSIGDALFVNSFGLVSDSEGAYTGTIDILACYGIDNLTALDNSKNSFYSTYVDLSHFNDSLYSIGEMGVNQKSWSIWGAPFGKKLVFFTKYTYPEASEFQSLSIYKMPLCYTNYKVRYFYFDEESGMHYGPWTNFIYFSDGRVFQSSIYEDNNGNVIDTPLQSGSQDSEGNVSINNSPGNLIELENPNELFGYLRSVLNNMNATNNTFSQLFGSVFNFLPPEILAIIFGGIAAMVFIGIVKSLAG